jgi:ATP-dependent exoDNAse (exonuclease V) alpha subunit
MAIYHLHAKIIQRSKGKNVVAAAAYRRAAELFDEKEQRMWNYSNKPDVVHSELAVPKDAPLWVQNLVELHSTQPSQAVGYLWNKVDAVEKRIDSQLAREIEFALPIELNLEQNIELARAFIQDQFCLRGMIADWNIHWDKGNPHVHVLLTMRGLIEEGFGKRMLEWNSKVLLHSFREKWAEYANYYLRLHEHSVSIDHRSYQDQGIDLIPTIHQGKAVTDMDRRGISTDIMREANSIRKENLARIAADPTVLFNKLSKQRDSFSGEEISQEVGR